MAFEVSIGDLILNSPPPHAAPGPSGCALFGVEEYLTNTNRWLVQWQNPSFIAVRVLKVAQEGKNLKYTTITPHILGI